MLTNLFQHDDLDAACASISHLDEYLDILESVSIESVDYDEYTSGLWEPKHPYVYVVIEEPKVYVFGDVLESISKINRLAKQ